MKLWQYVVTHGKQYSLDSTSVGTTRGDRANGDRFLLLVDAGDRELADAVKMSDLVQASGKAHPSYLHVFLKLSDVETVNVRTLMRELCLANPAAAEQYLSASLAKSSCAR